MKLKKEQTDVNLRYGSRCYRGDIASPEYSRIPQYRKLKLLQPKYDLRLHIGGEFIHKNTTF